MYAVHLRVSTDKQATEGESLEMQEKLAYSLVEAKNGKILKYILNREYQLVKKLYTKEKK